MPETNFTFMDDLQIATFIEKSDHRAIEHLYDKYSAALFGIICRIISKKEVAEECLLTTFKRAWNEIAAYQCSGNSLFTWLSAIARKSAFHILNEEHANPATLNCTNGECHNYSAFELVYFKGASLNEAAELSGITIAELQKTIRITLQNPIHKTPVNDQ